MNSKRETIKDLQIKVGFVTKMKEVEEAILAILNQPKQVRRKNAR